MKKYLISLIGLLTCLSLAAQWSNNPSENNRITPEGEYTLYSHQFAVTNDGYVYVVFLSPTGNGTATYLQIINPEGEKLFPDAGKLISNYPTPSFEVVGDYVFADADGNALIFVRDQRRQTGSQQEVSYIVYKVDKAGNFLWGDEGLNVKRRTPLNYLEACINAIQLEDGSYVLAWIGGAGSTGSLDITIERISGDGEFSWLAPLEIKDQPNVPYPKLVNAGNNQFILVYAKGAGRELTARKIDFDGETVWGDVRIYWSGFTLPALNGVFSVLPDNKGGVFVSWYDDRDASRFEKAYVSYVTAGGQLAFSNLYANGQVRVGIASNIRQFGPRMVYDESNNSLYVVWEETTTSQNYTSLLIQKVSAEDGELLWGEEGIKIAEAGSGEPEVTDAVSYHSIQKAGPGKFAVFYMHSAGPNQVVSNLAALFDGATGDYLWADKPGSDSTRLTGIVFSNYKYSAGGDTRNVKEGLESSVLIGNKYWLTLWDDYRGGSGLTNSVVYMQKVNLDATLGNGATAIQTPAIKKNNFITGATLIDGATQFTIDNAKAGLVNLSLYSVSGQKIAVIHNGSLNTGKQTIDWDSKTASVRPGVYLLTLSTPEGTGTTRIIIK
jgi:hypothetical protein